MRNIGKFVDEIHFPHGFLGDNAFTAEECQFLENFGLTMQGLQDGSVVPITATEHYFLAELDGEFPISSEEGKLWRKYNSKSIRCEQAALNRSRNKGVAKLSSSDEYNEELTSIEDSDEDDAGYDDIDL